MSRLNLVLILVQKPDLDEEFLFREDERELFPAAWATIYLLIETPPGAPATPRPNRTALFHKFF